MERPSPNRPLQQTNQRKILSGLNYHACGFAAERQVVMPTVELVGRTYVTPPLLIGIARPVVLGRALQGDKLNAAVLVGAALVKRS